MPSNLIPQDRAGYVALHRGYAANGDTQTLRSSGAASALPLVHQHLDRARKLD